MQTSKVIIYCRVSSREQEETGYSLDAQEKLLCEHAEKNGFVVAKTYKISESASGKQIRTSFKEMFEFANKKAVPVILCEKIDRLTRNLKDAATANDWVQADEHREIHFVKENFVVSKDTRAHENFVWDMKVAMARFYTNNLSEEVRKGQKEKLAQGWLPTKPPLGYRTVGEKGHKVHVIDEEKALFVRKAFEYYASGNYSLMALQNKLHKEGLRTRLGAKLSKSRLDDILRDPFYHGSIRWNDVVYAGGSHEPLVSTETFKRVQEVLSGKTTPHFNRHEFQFRKKLTCGECRGSVTAEIQKGIVYYHCNHYRNCSQKKYTPEKQVEEQLLGVFKFFENITPEEAEIIKTRIKQNHAQEIEYKEATLKTLNDRYSTLQRRLDNLYDDRLDERITAEFWSKKQKDITDEQNALQDQIKALKSEEAKYFEIWLNILDLALRAREIYERRTPEQRRLLLAHIFSSLMLKDSEVDPVFKAPVAKLAQRVQERIDAQKTFERTQKAAKGGSLRGVSVNNTHSDGVESLEPRKHFRTSKNPQTTVRFDSSHLKSGGLLRG